MILTLPNDVSSRILGDFVSLRGLILLDNALCCKQRQSFHQLLSLVPLRSKVIVSKDVCAWLSRHQIRAFSIQIKDKHVDEVLQTSKLFHWLHHLDIKSNFSCFQLDQLITTIATHCPNVKSLQLQDTGGSSPRSRGLSSLLNKRVELRHFHVYNVYFPPETWIELCRGQVSFLCVTEYRAHVRELILATGPLPEANMDVVKAGESRQNCVWNKMDIPEVNQIISTFLPSRRVAGVSYLRLCKGPSLTMFGGTFCLLAFIQLHNCLDMDAHTFTIILQQPYVSVIDLHRNNTVCGILATVSSLGRRISTIEFNSFTALTTESVNAIKRMLDPHASVFCSSMPQIVHDKVDWVVGELSLSWE